MPDLPRDMSAVTARLQPVDPEVVPKLVDGDGMRKVLLTQFVRSVERVVRPVVSASRVPLILAATDEIGTIYRSLNHYELLAEQTIGGSIDTPQEEEALRQAVIPIVQALRQARLDRWVALTASARTTTAPSPISPPSPGWRARDRSATCWSISTRCSTVSWTNAASCR